MAQLVKANRAENIPVLSGRLVSDLHRYKKYIKCYWDVFETFGPDWIRAPTFCLLALKCVEIMYSQLRLIRIRIIRIFVQFVCI